MKWKHKIALVFQLILGSFTAGNAQWGPFHYQRDLPASNTGWQEIGLPDDMYRHLQLDLADLRIKGITGTGDTLEAPYLIQWTNALATERQQPFRIINESRRGGDFFATLTSDQQPEIDQIQLSLGNKNFDWRVRLEGSQDQREWFTLTDNYRILAFDESSGKYVFTKLKFPKASYRYYRIRIHEPGNVQLKAATFTEVPVEQPPYRSYPIQQSEIQENKEQQQSRITGSLAVPVPVSRIRLEVIDTIDYYRPLRIDLLTDSTRQESGWKYHYTTVFRGTLSSLEAPVFTFPTTRTQTFRIQVDNHDNPPLRIQPAAIDGLPPRIITRITQAGEYTLLYGWSDATPPRYDITKFTDKIPEVLPEIQPGPERQLRPEAGGASPLLVNRAWLWAVMLVVIGLLGWFAVKMLSNSKL